MFHRPNSSQDYSAKLAIEPLQCLVRDGRVIQPMDATVLSANLLDSWQENFWWPVGDTAFTDFASATNDSLVTAIQSLDAEDADLLLADSGLVSVIQQHVHVTAAWRRFLDERQVPIYGEMLSRLATPRWLDLRAAFRTDLPLTGRFRLAARQTVKNLCLNTNVSIWRRVLSTVGRGDVAVVGSSSHLMRELLSRTGESAYHLYVLPYAVGLNTGAAISNDLEIGAGQVICAVAVHAREHLGVDLDTGEATAAWIARLSTLNASRSALRRSLKPNGRLFLSNIGNPYHRLAAGIWRENGQEVVGFHHGNYMGEQPNQMTGISEYGVCDTFVVPSSTSATWIAQKYAMGPQPRPVRFVSADTDQYLKWRESMRSEPFPTDRSVMIVAYPPNWNRYHSYAGHHALIQFDLELRLAACLSRAGWRVLVKVHPEWRALSAMLWQGRAAEILDEPLEQCWQRAGAFVFPRASSTTFGFSLCTNRPVLLIDTESQPWNQEAYDLLRTRCRMVPAHLDAQNRIRFDEARLLSDLNAGPGNIDFSYVEQVMYPSPPSRAAAA